MGYSWEGVFGVKVLELRVKVVILQPCVCKDADRQIVVAHSRTVVHSPVELRVHVAEDVLATNGSGVIVRLPLRAEKTVATNPLDVPAIGKLISVINLHFLPRFEEVDGRLRVIHIEVVVVVLKLYREINLRHVCPDGGNIAFQRRTHYVLVVVHKPVAEADRVDTQPTLWVFHRVENQLYLSGVLQHFFRTE